MAESSYRQGALGHRSAKAGFVISILLVALTSAAWIVVPVMGPQSTSYASAAEVDATGVPAPVGFADIIARVKPAVVGVRVKIEKAAPSNESGQEYGRSRSPFEQFFRQFGIPAPETPLPGTEIALGSGFFISSDGYIVTNNHVVENGTSFEVTTDDGNSYPAKVIGKDPQTDLALIKVNSAKNFPYVRFATTEPRVGDWVLAVGSPFGLGGTVTAGIVSARGRDIGAGPYEDFIQIDAPVNKGNSGGPSFNVKGEVIGVNTAIYSPSGGSVGVAFDIPAETVKLVVNQLKNRGFVTRGWIGVQIQPVTPAIAQAVGLKKAEGALVAQLEPSSPAGKGGIEVGDVIVSVNGQAVRDARDLAKKIAVLAPGSTAKIGIFRDEKEKSVAVILGEFPRKSPQAKMAAPTSPKEQSKLGLTLESAKAVAGAGNEGLVIIGIRPNGRAAESGLRTGDVILSVGHHPVSTPADFSKIVDAARMHSKHVILIRIKRGDVRSFVAISIE